LQKKHLHKQPVPDFRLPDTVRPTRYRLDLNILPDQPTFQGRAIISVELKERTDTVSLNAKDLTISAIKVRFYGSPVGRVAPVRWRTTDEMLAVELEHAMGPGATEIEIYYTGKYADWLQKTLPANPPAPQQGASVEEFLKAQSSPAAGASKA
jgi:aminopeptidase N